MKTFFALVLLAALAFAAYTYALAPYGPSAETFVEIPPGTGTSGIAQRLAAAGIIRSAATFTALRKIRGGTLKAGEYRFDHPIAPTEVFNRIHRGDVFTLAVTIPEGFNIFDIAQAMETAGLGNAQTFLAAERANTALIQDLSPHAPSLEGFLFPDTYRFSRHSTPQQILSTMVRRFRQETATLGIGDANRTVTMASLIEKEVRQDSERPMVAGVFGNRLSKSMPLQTDPTVIYAAELDGRWRGVIHQSDLASESPYNTYRHPGLPPGPIASPGLAALRAALHPTPTDNLFFVADAEGHTLFSRDLATHATQVQSYRETLAAQP